MTIVNEPLNTRFPFHSLPEGFPSQCVILDTGKSIAELLFYYHLVRTSGGLRGSIGLDIYRCRARARYNSPGTHALL